MRSFPRQGGNDSEPPKQKRCSTATVAVAMSLFLGACMSWQPIPVTSLHGVVDAQSPSAVRVTTNDSTFVLNDPSTSETEIWGLQVTGRNLSGHDYFTRIMLRSEIVKAEVRQLDALRSLGAVLLAGATAWLYVGLTWDLDTFGPGFK